MMDKGLYLPLKGAALSSAKNKSRRKVILDTNIILFDAQAIFKFLDSEIYIPISVIEEIDRFKRDIGENGRNARQFSRFIDTLRKKGSLSAGVELEKSRSTITVNRDLIDDSLPADLDPAKADTRILGTAVSLKKQNPELAVDLITKDINLRIKADVIGINALDYEPDSVAIEDMYTGMFELELPPDAIEEFYKNKKLENIDNPNLLANQYVLMKDQANPNHTAIGRYTENPNQIIPLIRPVESVWGFNLETLSKPLHWIVC
jgi:PhoH-like ATPase